MALFSGLNSWLNKADASGATRGDKLDLLASALMDTGDMGDRYASGRQALEGRRAKAAQQAALQNIINLSQGSFDTPLTADVEEGQTQAPRLSATPTDMPLVTGINPNAPRPAISDYLPTRTLPKLNLTVPQRSAPRGLNDPKMQQALMAGIAGRVPGVGDIIGLMDKTRPTVKFSPTGIAYDERDPSMLGKFAPTLDKGQEPLFDARGNVVGVRNMDGSVQAAAEMAGAVEGAKTRASAPYQDVTVQGRGGQPITMSRSAFAASGGQFEGPTPAQAALNEGRARNQVEQEGFRSKAFEQARMDLPKLEDQANFTIGIIDKIRNHPSLDARTGNSTLLPALRPQDVDFDTMVSQVSGGAFLQAIESLKGSGQITEIEGKKATDAIARMSNQRQSKQGFLDAMADYEGVVQAGLSRARQKAQGGSGPSRAGRPSTAEMMEEARRRGLIR